MNLLQIAQRIARECDEPSITTVEGSIDDFVQSIVDWINEGYGDIWNSLYTNEYAQSTGSINTVAGQKYVNIPSGVLNLTGIGFEPNTQYYQLREVVPIIPFNEFRLSYYNDYLQDIQPGLPYVASVYGRKLYLYPTPDAVYQLNYTANNEFTRLSNDDDEPVFPAQFHNALVEYGKYKLYSRERDTEGAQMAFVDFNRHKTKLISHHNAHNDLPAMMLPEEAFNRGYSAHYE